jgi:drug/metabolite transporter (DMT)-like permease
VAAVLYVGVALATLTDVATNAAVGLGVFIAAQLIWQVNSVLDVRLARRTAQHPRHYLTDRDIDQNGGR